MNKVSTKLLFLILALSVVSMSAHGFVEHEAETCKVCLFKYNERDDLDSNDLDNGLCPNEIEVSIQKTPNHFIANSFHSVSKQSKGLNHNRGPPVIS
jgi:hypothetical protein